MRVSLTRIDLDVRLDYRHRTLAGSAVMSVRNHQAQPTSSIPVQVGRLMEVSSVTDAQGTPLHFTQDVVRFTDAPAYQVNQVSIELPQPLAGGDSTRLTVRYAGILVPYTETGMLYVREKIDSAFTMLRSESFGFPVLGLPSVDANRSAPRGDFDFSARVTVPKYEVVATGGELVRRTETDSTATYEYRSIKPVMFLNIGIAPYRVLDENMRVFYFPEDSAGAALLLRSGQVALDSMTRWFGPVGSTMRPSIIEIGDGFGSQAALAAGIFQQSSGFSKDGVGELYHELSHLWNAPEPPKSARWNEGLAMFLETLLMEQLDGWPKRRSWTETRAVQFVQAHANDSSVTQVPFVDYGSHGSTDNSYSVGNFMFYVLYDVVGPAEFNRLIGGFYQRYGRTGGTDREFADFIRQKAKVPLESLLNDWFFTTRWYERLRAGETLPAMVLTYRGLKVSYR